jgi:hypothetical protein
VDGNECGRYAMSRRVAAMAVLSQERTWGLYVNRPEDDAKQTWPVKGLFGSYEWHNAQSVTEQEQSKIDSCWNIYTYSRGQITLAEIEQGRINRIYRTSTSISSFRDLASMKMQ